jgi:hypothetical protein
VRLALSPRHRARLASGVLVLGLAAVSSAVHAAPFPPETDLSSLLPENGGDGTQGVVLLGFHNGDQLGRAVAAAGDVNGDGVDDLIAGARRATYNGESRVGQSYVVFGHRSSFAPSLSLADLLPANGGDGSQGVVFSGLPDSDSATGVGGEGDFNGDGYSDVIIGAPLANPRARNDAGQSYIVYGRAGFPALIELSDLVSGDGTQGFALDGIRDGGYGEVRDNSGQAVAMAGDVNADGYADAMIGAPNASLPNNVLRAGQTYLVFGSAGGFPPEFDLRNLMPEHGGDGSAGVLFDGPNEEARAGESISRAGDVNGDGIDDFIVGAALGGSYQGQSYVIFGRTSGFPARFSFADLLPENGGDGSFGFVLGNSPSLETGASVAGVGDVNGDGLGDLLVTGSFNFGPPAPSSFGYVVFGSASGFPALFNLGSLLPEQGGDGSKGFALIGNKAELDFSEAGAAGDVNGDGISDFIVGASSGDPGGISSAGRCYVVFGRHAGFPAEFTMGSLLAANGGDGSRGFVLNGPEGATCFSVSGRADINGDGVTDLIIGAPYGGNSDEGRVYVFFGRTGDSDGDGVADNRDNCTQVFNPDQRDTDGDGFGNICDADLDNNCLVAGNDWLILKSRFGTHDPDADFDGNGVVGRSDAVIFFHDKALPPGPSGVPNICD